jgi:hypothetical protein
MTAGLGYVPGRGPPPPATPSAVPSRLGSGLPSAALAEYLPNNGEQDNAPHTGEIIL